MSQNKPRILFIQADDLEFSASKSWAFSCQYGLIEGIRNIGFRVDLFFAYQLDTLEMRIKSIKYDYCIINCALHLLKNDLYFNEDRINLIRNSCKKLIGFMVEALHYYDDDGRQFQWSGDRLIGLKKYVNYFDAFATFNSDDVNFIKQNFLKPAYVFRPTLPLKYFKKPRNQKLIETRKSRKMVVVATIYGERHEFLKKYSDILEVKSVKERDIEFIYNRLTRLLFKRSNNQSIIIDKAIQWLIILLKKIYFNRYLKKLESGTGVLHPLSYFPDIHCRYIEAIAAGNICFHPELSLPTMDSTQYQMMKDIIYYNRGNFRDVYMSATSDYIEFRRILNSAHKAAIQSSTTEIEMRRLISIFENL